METSRKKYTSGRMPLAARNFFLNAVMDAEGQICGTMYNIFFEHEISFYGLADAVLKIDHILDELGCVQASTELRSYFEKREKANSNLLSMEERIKEENRVHIQYKDIESLNAESEGKLNCFIVEILYRQNSSWQGCCTWSNHSKNPKKECFRSVLELLKLIQSSFEAE